ncbi:hypothetical protein BVG19_g1019 [[Candida] boidinii]|nr:hypothetical protein BVG19_g1019 [[Candida] boidinii]OWB50628.1 hypothetical protein B5S27_g2180 [[Candida] boidinii]
MIRNKLFSRSIKNLSIIDSTYSKLSKIPNASHNLKLTSDTLYVNPTITTTTSTDHSKDLKPPSNVKFFKNLVNRSSNVNNNSNDNNKDNLNKKLIDKKANLGTTIRYLIENLPNSLNSTLDSEKLSSDIILRILPRSHPNIPIFKGLIVYLTTIKTLQLILTTFFINKNVKLHLSSIKVLENTENSSLNNNELVNISNGISIMNEINKTAGSSGTGGIYSNSTKIIIKFRSCINGCNHLINKNQNFNTISNTKLGEIKFNSNDNNLIFSNLLNSSNNLNFFEKNSGLLNKNSIFDSLISNLNLTSTNNDNNDNNNNDSNKNNNNNSSSSVSSSSSPTSQTMSSSESDIKPDKLKNTNNNKLERILSGVFIFELNSNNDKILVQTIDEFEVIENEDGEFINDDDQTLGLANPSC